jgi:hypothetical protein
MDIIEFANRHQDVLDECDFLVWLPTNTHVYFVFEQLADAVWMRGRRHYSSRTIGEKMRYDHDVRSNDKYKLRNAVTPYLGRLYVLRHPERLDLFKYQIKDHDFRGYVSLQQFLGLL